MKYPTQKQVSSKVTPMSQQISKRQPPQFNKETFNKVYDDVFLKSYKEDKLFHHSLKKMNCTLPKYFNDLYTTKELSKRITLSQHFCQKTLYTYVFYYDSFFLLHYATNR